MIICCGEALIDMVRMPVSGLGENFLPLPGGSPYNVAVAIGRLGVPVQFLGRFSTDFFGEMLVKHLRHNHVGDDLIIRCEHNTTLAFVKEEKDKGPQYIFYAEKTADCSLSAEDLPLHLPADTACIVFGSIAMTMEPIASTIETFIVRESGREIPVISFDPNIRPFMIGDRDAYLRRFEKWAGASAITKISSEDAEFIYPKIEPEQALRRILSLGSRLAICTMGVRGAIAMLKRDDGSITEVAAPVVYFPKVVDSVGAGDTFHGAFLSWLELRGKMSRSALANLGQTELYDALIFANNAASIVCSRRGADPPKLKEVENVKNKLT